MKKVLFVQPNLRPGGGNTVAAWMLEALKKEVDLSVLTWEPIDFEAANSLFGTSLCPTDFHKIYHSPGWLRALFSLDPDPYSLQPFCVLMRWCKLMGGRYDVLLSAADELDFGRKAIQYIHYPYLAPFYRRPRLIDRYRPWRIVSGFSFERMKNNLILVNSDWTGARFKERYGVAARTLYPPAPGRFPATPWTERENGFVCIGQIVSGKRLVELIRILATVRAHGHDIHLHIIGTPWDTPEGRQYHRRIERLAKEQASWVRLHENLPRARMVELVACHKYGLHCKIDEHFGIAIAEMVRAGCIVFAPASGGPAEIVGHDDRLLFGTDEEAVAKIERVLCSRSEQDMLRKRLESRQNLFSPARFMREIAEIVRDFTPAEGPLR